MAQKKRQKTSSAKENKSKNRFKLNASKVTTIIVLIAVAVFFIVNNFINKNEPEVKYYTFKKEAVIRSPKS